MIHDRGQVPVIHQHALVFLQAGATAESVAKQRIWWQAGTGRRSCHACQVPDDLRPPDTRRARLWTAAESRNVPLRAILVTVAVVAAAYLAGKLIYRLRDVILLMVVAGFVALILNPLSCWPCSASASGGAGWRFPW